MNLRNLKKFTFTTLLFVVCFCICSCSTEKRLPSAKDDLKHSRKYTGNSYTLGERKVLDILKLQDDLFADPNINNMGAFAHSELQTKALRIDAMWRTYFIENPNDVSALVLYGKFLRRIGQDAKAYETFVRVDKINPKIAVVKQQLSALEAESAQVKEAFKHIMQALELEPDNSTYLTQLVYILVLGKNTLVNSAVISNKDFDRLLTDSYRKIYENNPTNQDAKIRYAQSFYDLFEPNWQKALSIWNEIYQDSTLNIERQTAQANMARILVELNRDNEAIDMLKNVNLPNLERAKRLLLNEIERAKKPNLNKK